LIAEVHECGMSSLVCARAFARECKTNCRRFDNFLITIALTRIGRGISSYVLCVLVTLHSHYLAQYTATNW